MLSVSAKGKPRDSLGIIRRRSTALNRQNAFPTSVIEKRRFSRFRSVMPNSLYPEAYRDCTDEAQEEKTANARPELTAAVENFDDYDTIFLGYPIWWGDMPISHTFSKILSRSVCRFIIQFILMLLYKSIY